MKTRIAKQFKWEMSHRLPYHKGLCKNLHGHSYKMLVEVEGETDETGMLIDYYDLSQIVKPIIDNFDHSFVVDKDDDLMINFLRENGFKHMILPCYSTAENLASYIAKLLAKQLQKVNNIHYLKVRLYETGGVYADSEIGL